MFEYLKNLHWRKQHMIFECETMAELEDHYITRFENANNEAIGSAQTEKLVVNNQKMYARDFKILMARITTTKSQKIEKPKKLKDLAKEKQEQSKAIFCPTVKVDKKEEN